MSVQDVWSPFAPCSPEETAQFLNRALGKGKGDDERTIRAANAAVGHMEARCRRRLVYRTYRDAADVASCTVTIGDADVTGTGFTAGAKDGDSVTGTGLQPGSRVASVTSNTALVLDRPALTTGTVTLTFGSERMQLDGSGKSGLYLPERPVHEVYDAAYLDDAGQETALDLTGQRLDRETGYLLLPNDTFPEGELNILVGCAAGYREPSATVRGNFTEWNALQRLFLRLAQVYFQDEEQQPGRIVDRKILQGGGTIPDFRLPDDIRMLIAQFERLW